MDRVYEKPMMKFVPIRGQEAVAFKCWGWHDTGWFNVFYDIKGAGYVKFQVDGGSCNLSMTNVTYHKGADDVEGTPLQDGDPYYEEWEAAIAAAGGNTGNPVCPDGGPFTPDNPGPGFSY